MHFHLCEIAVHIHTQSKYSPVRVFGISCMTTIFGCSIKFQPLFLYNWHPACHRNYQKGQGFLTAPLTIQLDHSERNFTTAVNGYKVRYTKRSQRSKTNGRLLIQSKLLLLARIRHASSKLKRTLLTLRNSDAQKFLPESKPPRKLKLGIKEQREFEMSQFESVSLSKQWSFSLLKHDKRAYNPP